MDLIDEKHLSPEVSSIIFEMISTGIFTDKKIDTRRATKDHLQVQKYLNALYNGDFLKVAGLPPHYTAHLSPNFLDPLIGDWLVIREAVMASIPETPEYKCSIATFFVNPYKGHSWFLTRVKPQAARSVKIQTNVKELKRRLPDDMARCSELYCPKYETCLRSQPVKGMVWYQAFVYGPDGCEYFIGE